MPLTVLGFQNSEGQMVELRTNVETDQEWDELSTILGLANTLSGGENFQPYENGFTVGNDAPAWFQPDLETPVNENADTMTALRNFRQALEREVQLKSV